MRKRTSLFLSILVALGMLSTTVSADIKKGQKAYFKKCKNCHGTGTKGAALKTQEGWEEVFEDDSTLMKEWHKGDKSEKFFNSREYKKLAPHLKDFLYEYGSDSGNVPSCG